MPIYCLTARNAGMAATYRQRAAAVSTGAESGEDSPSAPIPAESAGSAIAIRGEQPERQRRAGRIEYTPARDQPGSPANDARNPARDRQSIPRSVDGKCPPTGHRDTVSCIRCAATSATLHVGSPTTGKLKWSLIDKPPA